MRFRPVLLAVVALAVALAALADNGVVLAGKVVSVQDGDTITILDPELLMYRIRLSGIDAPEKDQPFGTTSRDHLSQLCDGRLVTASCPKMDRYGRMVCTVWVDDVDVSLAQLRAGLAWHFKRYASEQTPSDRETYALAEVEARAAHLGLWSDESPIAPWDWRHMKSGSTVGPSGYPISMMVFAIDNSKVGAPTLGARPRRYRQP